MARFGDGAASRTDQGTIVDLVGRLSAASSG
jgi:hypothetical protein